MIECLKNCTITPNWLCLCGVICGLAILVVTLWSIVTAAAQAYRLWVLSLLLAISQALALCFPDLFYFLILIPLCLPLGFLSSAYFGFCSLFQVSEVGLDYHLRRFFFANLLLQGCRFTCQRCASRTLGILVCSFAFVSQCTFSPDFLCRLLVLCALSLQACVGFPVAFLLIISS